MMAEGTGGLRDGHEPASEPTAPEERRQRILSRARRTLQLEAEGVAGLQDRLDDAFVEAVERILGATGRVVVTGIGKSGLVARKIASTLASTGTPALFLHPVEGVHGDVGVLLRGDLLIVVSRSGESAELTALMPAVKRLGIPVIALTGRSGSTLGRHADLVLDVGVAEEACPHDLSPTSSSTAAMAMGDALAMALLELREFGPKDFARLHPGGVLGRRLLWRVEDVMVKDPEEVPALMPDATLADAMWQVAHRRGTVPVVDKDRRVIGVLTAGDLTRYASENPDFLSRPVKVAMNPVPKLVGIDGLAAEAVRDMETHGIMAMPVVDTEGRLQGMVHLHDLLRAGVA